MTITLLAPDGVAVSAQQERQAKAPQHGGGAGRPLGGRSGFRIGTPSTVLTATSTTWTLGPCAAEIDPGASTHQGMYGWATDANISGAITAADATYARKDTVYIQVNDPTAGDGSGSVGYAPQYLAGTPAASPTAPALPARSFLVGTINMPQAGGGAPTVVLNPARYVAAGAIQPVWSQAEFDGLVPYESFTVRRMDLPLAPVWAFVSGAWAPDLPGLPGYVSDGTVSTGLSGSGVMCNSVIANLVAGRRYRAVFRFTARSTEANLGIIASIRTSAAGDTSSAGTVVPFEPILYTSPRVSSWGGQRVEVTWTQATTATLAVKAVLARIVGTDAFDIADRVLYVEDMGAA